MTETLTAPAERHNPLHSPPPEEKNRKQTVTLANFRRRFADHCRNLTSGDENAIAEYSRTVDHRGDSFLQIQAHCEGAQSSPTILRITRDLRDEFPAVLAHAFEQVTGRDPHENDD